MATRRLQPAESIVNPAVIGYQPNPDFAELRRPVTPTAAKKLLEESGEKLPYPIKFTYPSRHADRRQGGRGAQGGLGRRPASRSTLDPLTDTYYDVIQKPTADSDVIWGGWGADWPSIATVIPPLFDSRINLTAASNGQDYGNYRATRSTS